MTISVILMLLGLLGLGLALRQSDTSSPVMTLSLSSPQSAPDLIVIPWCDYRCLFVTQVCGSLSVIVCTLGYLLWLLRFVWLY